MKFTRVNRVLLALLLASGIQLSLTTCTSTGKVQSSTSDNALEKVIPEEVKEEVVSHHR